jgi:hypothetical protein
MPLPGILDVVHVPGWDSKAWVVSSCYPKDTSWETYIFARSCCDGTPTKRQDSKRQVSKRLVSKRSVSKRQVCKMSGLQNVRFQNV